MNNVNENTLVSIIIPLYNAEKYFEETLNSVIAQTYTEWEIICIDDCSTDNSLQIAREYAEKDSRIKVFVNEKNSGPAVTRNYALEKCRGRYISFFDSDDLWMPEKLEKQIAFMNDKKIGVCITGYQTIESDGTFRNNVKVPARTGYNQMLSNTLTCTPSILIDTLIVDKHLLTMPPIKAAEDLVAWLRILKNGHDFYGMPDILAKYRKHPNSVSSNKFRAAKHTWKVYREFEHLSIVRSAWCFVGYAFHAVVKRLPGIKK